MNVEKRSRDVRMRGGGKTNEAAKLTGRPPGSLAAWCGSELGGSHSAAKWGVNRDCKRGRFLNVFARVTLHTGLNARRECHFGLPRGSDNRLRKTGRKLKGFVGSGCSEAFSFEV